MKSILLDLDGVFYEGGQPINNAPEVVQWLKARGIPHLFLTNTTSRPRSALVEKLTDMGIGVEAGQILTPSVAAVRWLKSNVEGDVALFVPEATKGEFSELSIASERTESGAGAVVIGDLGEDWDFATLNRAFRLLISESKPPLIALGMTRYWRAADGLRLDVAPFIVALEYATGTRPLILGKPAKPFYQAALDTLGAKASQTFMIGDDIRGDIDGAQKAGLKGLLVRTGKYRSSDLALDIMPHAVLDSIAELSSWWERHEEGQDSTVSP